MAVPSPRAATVPGVRRSRRAALALLLLPLAGCGFHPLYAAKTDLVDEPELAAIKVNPIPDRIGQQLAWLLRERLNPSGLAVDKRYALSVTMQITRYDLGIRRDATATRGEIRMSVSYTLTDLQQQRDAYRNSSQAVTSYNILDDAYATEVAAQDAAERSMRDLGEEISLQLALFVRRQHKAA